MHYAVKKFHTIMGWFNCKKKLVFSSVVTSVSADEIGKRHLLCADRFALAARNDG